MYCIAESALVSAAPLEDSYSCGLVRFQIQMAKAHIGWLFDAEGCMCCPYPQTVTKLNNELYIIYVTTVHCTTQLGNP